MANGQEEQAAARRAAELIAIVGIGCKLPGDISSVDDLLAALRDGRDCITEVPPDRWDVDSYYDPDPLTPGKMYVRHGGFVTDIDRFDAAFFGISDAEACRMDPQQRMALQTVWHALEDAGQSVEELLQSNTGVFLATMNTNGYSQLKLSGEGVEGITAYDAMGDAMSITAGRISHFLGLEGPCLAVDTACSGSMVALHLARQSILAGDCDAAIVVGVSAIVYPSVHLAFSKIGLMSRAGRCRAFDAAADGYVRGEGCVAVLVRRQSLALARGDRIRATICGTAVNQDGRTPALTAPNGLTQEKVIRTALARMGASPNQIGYVEAHGTGTTVGDPIEMSALANVYGPGRQEPLFVGSVKSNFGHIESGAGLLGTVKAALSLDQEMIFPSLHFTRLNPNIDLGRAPVQVPTTTIPWPRGQAARMAGVNSFGYSGTNAHTILQEAPPADGAAPPQAPRPCELVVLSAKSAGSLQELADRWIDFLERPTAAHLPDVAFTAGTGRAHLRHRLAVVGRDRDEVKQRLRTWREGRTAKGLAAGQAAIRRRPKIAFMFSGQGAQHSGMGRQLYQAEPRFAAAVDRCAAVMDPLLGAPLAEVLFGPASAELLGNTRFVQPALFAIEYALAELLRHWGVEPDVVVGHSVGEIVAACVAGVLDLESAARFVVARGRVLGQLPAGGAMLAVDATLEQVQEWTRGREGEVSVAAVNGPHSVVVSGAAAAVDAVAALAAAARRRMKRLDVSHAFHSPLMDPALAELEREAGSLRVSPARLPVVSNVTGGILSDGITADYWSSHVRQPVLFHQGLCTVVDAGCSILIEVGPHPALIQAAAGAFDASRVRCLPTLSRDHEDVFHLLHCLGSLYVDGVPVNLNRLFWSPAYRRVSLPLYPFRRDRHWIQGIQAADPAPQRQPQVAVQLHPLLGRAVSLGSRRAVFESSLAATRPWVDHRVLGATVFPGTGYLEMAARAFAASTGHDWRSVVLRNLGFERPLVLTYGKPRQVSLVLDNLPVNGSGEASFAIAAAGNGTQERYCHGRIAVAAADEAERISLESELGRMASKLPTGPFYGDLRKSGLEYGASFSTVREVWVGPADSGEAIGRITASSQPGQAADHPFTLTAMLDGCLQVFGAALTTVSGLDELGAFVPASIQSVVLRRQPSAQVWSRARVQLSSDGRAALVEIRVLTDEGETIAEINGLELRRKASLAPARESDGAGQPTADDAAEPGDRFLARIRALPHAERLAAAIQWLSSEVKATMGHSSESVDLDAIDPSTAFLEIGLDSLLVTELQRRIQEKLAFRFRPMQGLDYQSIESLAEYVINDVLHIAPAADARTATMVRTAL